ncbi:hypothetical protein [Marinicauda salina]|nr:hypothetical protein [Marinicauda salina]
MDDGEHHDEGFVRPHSIRWGVIALMIALFFAIAAAYAAIS